MGTIGPDRCWLKPPTCIPHVPLGVTHFAQLNATPGTLYVAVVVFMPSVRMVTTAPGCRAAIALAVAQFPPY